METQKALETVKKAGVTVYKPNQSSFIEQCDKLKKSFAEHLLGRDTRALWSACEEWARVSKICESDSRIDEGK